MTPTEKTAREKASKNQIASRQGTLADAVALSPFPTISAVDIKLADPEYILKGIIAPAEFSVWYGESASGKGFAMLAIAHAIATGKPILGRRVRKAPVLVCALEGAVGYKRRVIAISRDKGPVPNLHVFSGAVRLHDNDVDTTKLIATVKKLNAMVVIIDTLSRAMPGGEENGSPDMTRLIAACTRICLETGAAVCMVHHCGKDRSKGGRGHSSLKAAADVEVEISKLESGARQLCLTKVKDGREDLAYKFELREVVLGLDADGDPITTCVVDEFEEASIPSGASRVSKGNREALDWLAEAIKEQPVATPTDLPSNIRVTTKSAWLAIGKKRSGKAEDAIRKQVDRAIACLRTARVISFRDPYVWNLSND